MSALAARVVGTANELVAGQPKTSYRISVTVGGDASTCLRGFGDFQALHAALAKLKLSSLPSLPGKFELGLERADHLRAIHPEELDVPPADVLSVLSHRALAVVRAAELDVRLARRLLALVEHEVHAWWREWLG